MAVAFVLTNLEQNTVSNLYKAGCRRVYDLRVANNQARPIEEQTLIELRRWFISYEQSPDHRIVPKFDQDWVQTDDKIAVVVSAAQFEKVKMDGCELLDEDAESSVFHSHIPPIHLTQGLAQDVLMAYS